MRGLLAKGKKTLFWACLLILALIFPSIPIVKAIPDTFGRTDIAGTTWSFAHNVWVMTCKFNLFEDGDVIKMSLYCMSGASIKHWKTAIYDDNEGVPNNLLAESNEVYVDDALSWVHFCISVSLVAGDYWLAWFQDSDDMAQIKYDDVGTNQLAYRAIPNSYPIFPNPFGTPSYQKREVSIYATYIPIEEKDYGFALDFDGVDDYVSVAHDDTLNVGTGDFTIEFWFKTDVDEIECWFNKTDYMNGGQIFIYKGAFVHETINFYIADAGWINEATATAENMLEFFDGEWHHLIASKASGTLFIYIDNEQKASEDASSVGSLDTTAPIWLGRYTSLSWLASEIDEFRFYTRAISEAERTYSYYQGYGKYTPLNQTALVAWYHFDEGLGTEIFDETENNNDALLYGDTDEWVIGKVAKAPPKAQFFPYFGLGALFALMIGLVFGLGIGYKKR